MARTECARALPTIFECVHSLVLHVIRDAEYKDLIRISVLFIHEPAHN